MAGVLGCFGLVNDPSDGPFFPVRPISLFLTPNAEFGRHQRVQALRGDVAFAVETQSKGAIAQTLDR